MAVDAQTSVGRPSAPSSGMEKARAGRGVVFVSATRTPEGLSALVKRSIDVIGAALMLAGLAPVLAATAVLVRLDSPGPILIRQDRVGLGLRPFRMYKFRSMVAGANELQEGLHHLNEAGAHLFKIRKDPRITRLGGFLRRHSIDELPQLVNVLRGEMSLVGPRPPFSHEVEHDLIRQRARLRFPPGMTGLWQVSGRSALGYDSMVSLDLQYVRTWSVMKDVLILLRTVPAVLTGEGAW